MVGKREEKRINREGARVRGSGDQRIRGSEDQRERSCWMVILSEVEG